MKRPAPLLWISFGLISLTLSILLMGDLVVHFIPNPAVQIFEYRQKYSEALVVQYSLLAENGDSQAIQEAFDLLIERDEDIVSVAVILTDGKTLFFAGRHQEVWEQPLGDSSTPDHIQIPIFNNTEWWGTVQLRFRSLDDGGWLSWLKDPWIQFLGLLVGSGFMSYFLFMKRMPCQLDPSSVVQMQVKVAFDLLNEGIVFLDNGERIVLANRAFGNVVGKDPNELVGKRLDEYSWAWVPPAPLLTTLPWKTAREEKCVELDFPIMLLNAAGEFLKFRVNCTPILNEQAQVKGVLVSLIDVTKLEERICDLKSSKADLESLAMRDPLTGIFNRRALFEALVDLYDVSSSEKTDFGCIMADIDHFKSFNDRFGHAVGDQVIQVVTKILSTTIRPTDIMGRYGGEEFCILLPGQGPEGVAKAAERLRLAIVTRASQAVRTTGDNRITLSLGVSCFSLGATGPLELIDQADKALYVAKKAGRNQVGQWTQDGPRVGLPIELELVRISE
jgi:diguanylate cyclase (GGDEF)-like protein/PAS domain S-box-containing protein